MNISFVHVVVTSIPSEKTFFVNTVNNNNSWKQINLCMFKDIGNVRHEVKRNEMQMYWFLWFFVFFSQSLWIEGS